MNKKYKRLSFILIIGYGFFFTTRLWNIDDRPRFNTWESHTIGSNQGRIAIIDVVYVSPIDVLDIILEKTFFTPHHEFTLEAVVHRLDGTSDVAPLTMMNEATNINITRQFLRVYLEDDNLDWHFVEIASINEITNNRSRLTIDWRMVNRIDEITTVASYDLNFEDTLDAAVISDHHNPGQLHEHDDHEHHAHYHVTDLSLEGLTHSLDLAFTEYAIVNQLLLFDPEDDILIQSAEFYAREIERLGALIEEYHYESD